MSGNGYRFKKMWENEDFILTVYDTDIEGYMDKEVWYYQLYDKAWNETIFQDEDFSPGYGMSTDDGMIGLLTFFVLNKGDVETEFWGKYSERQLEWRDSDRREKLELAVMEMEERGTLI